MIYTLVETYDVFRLSVMPLHLRYILHNQCTALERLSSQVQPGFRRVEEGSSSRCFFIAFPSNPPTSPNPPKFNQHAPPQPQSCFSEDLVGENSGSKSTAHAHSASGFVCQRFFFVGYTFKNVFSYFCTFNEHS